jgi:hypothetical protein
MQEGQVLPVSAKTSPLFCPRGQGDVWQRIGEAADFEGGVEDWADGIRHGCTYSDQAGRSAPVVGAVPAPTGRQPTVCNRPVTQSEPVYQSPNLPQRINSRWAAPSHLGISVEEGAPCDRDSIRVQADLACPRLREQTPFRSLAFGVQPAVAANARMAARMCSGSVGQARMAESLTAWRKEDAVGQSLLSGTGTLVLIG